MRPPTPSFLLLSAALFLVAGPGFAFARGASMTPSPLFDHIDPQLIPSGILYDRVAGIGRAGRYDGSPDAPALDAAAFRQIYYEMRGAAIDPLPWIDVEMLREEARRRVAAGEIPIAVIDLDYERVRDSAIGDGALIVDGDRIRVGGTDAFVTRRLFAASALTRSTARGASVRFVLDAHHYFARGDSPNAVEIDFADGRGFRPMQIGEPADVTFNRVGKHTVRLRVATNTRVEHAAFTIDVTQLAAPAPDDTIAVTASVPYNGQFGGGQAYVYLAPGHTSLVNPAIVVEGFDLDNSMNWDELYELLNDENLVEDMRAQGFDAVVLNFAEATDYVQRNAFVIMELIEQVESMAPPHATVAVAGASMGGLCARYALAYMETNAIPHRVRVFISLDSPHSGANIPLGVQHWVDFFSGLSAEADALLSSLNSPAARQMLVYHHSNSGVGADPLRADLLADLAAVGGYPAQPRTVAIANGTGAQTNQGFAAGDKIIDYEFSNVLTTIVGNVWAVPDAVNQVIFEGEIRILFPLDQETISVSGTQPYDNAPGGWRNSMQQMDETEAPYGDIIALHDNHCFIPSVSALDLSVGDLFYDIGGDPDPLSLSPFDAIYFPTTPNQGHVDITPENKAWVMGEVQFGVTAVGPGATRSRIIALHQNQPNPFNPSTTIRLELPEPAHVLLTVHSVTGQLVRMLFEGVVQPGVRNVVWDGRDDTGVGVASGVYFYRLRTADQLHTRKMVLLK